MEVEKRLTSAVLADSPFHFDLHTIEYKVEETSSHTTPMTGHYKLFEKGYVELAADIVAETVNVTLVNAVTERERVWKSTVRHKTYSVEETAADMYAKLQEADMDDARDPADTFLYAKEYPRPLLEQVIRKSLELRGLTEVTDRARQTLLKSLGTLCRTATESVRYDSIPNDMRELSTRNRQASSVSAAELRRDKTYFYTTETPRGLKDEQIEFYAEVADTSNGYRTYNVANPDDFKTPLNGVIADSEPEKRFVRALIDPVNLPFLNAWLKSVHVGFYEIDYSWKKGNHTKRGKFSPDFFIKSGEDIFVVEIKDDDEIREPSAENRAKRKAAQEHFTRLNSRLEQAGLLTRYRFHFLTPADYNTFFTYLRAGNMDAFESGLDVELNSAPV